MQRVIVHEPVSLWSAELQRGLRESGEVTVRWAPHPLDVREACAVGQAEVLVLVDAEGDAERLCQIWESIRTAPHPAKRVLLTGNHTEEWEWTVRELGFDVVLPETTEKHRVVHSVRRLLAPDTADPPRQ
jgi:DNA-binding NarL/FixJ family response regulator